MLDLESGGTRISNCETFTLLWTEIKVPNRANFYDKFLAIG